MKTKQLMQSRKREGERERDFNESKKIMGLGGPLSIFGWGIEKYAFER